MVAVDRAAVEGEEPVLVRREGAVAVVTLNRPQVLNAVTAEMAAAYALALRAADADPQVRVIVVTGAGRGFCSGADLGVLDGGAGSIRRFLPAGEDGPELGLSLRTPLVAAVNGPVAGLGFAFLLGCDVRFAVRGARMSTSFARLGLVAEYGVSWLLPRLIGTGPALELMLSGRTIDAEEAAALGLVHRVCAPGEVVDRALEYAAELAARCSPASMAAIKAQVYGDLERPRGEALARALALMDHSFDWPDLAEALAARRAGRPPAFPPLG